MIYRQFLANVIEAGLVDYVLPFPCDSLNAATCISRCGITPDLIHLDAAHEYEAVKADIATWWPLLRTGGHMIFDDYDGGGTYWPGVRRAVDEHLASVPHDYFQYPGIKARVRKL